MRQRALFLISFAFLVVAMASCGGSRPPITVSVTAGVTTLSVNGTTFFTATVINSSNQNVTWAVVGGASNGTIDPATGFYTAPATVPNPPAIMVTATSQANMSVSGQGNVTVTIGVTVSPAIATVQTLNSAPFTATVQGSSNQSVTWQVNGIAGGNRSVGSISSSGSYLAPESVPVNAASGQTTTVSVTAIAAANPAISASARVTITSANQLGQNTPVKLGASGGNVNNVTSTECASGTLGSLVTRAGTQFILSNNHVLADSDAGNIGDGITQPGLIDAPNPCFSGGTTTVAHLSQFINLESASPPPAADAAIAQVFSSTVDTSGAILEIGDSTNGNGVPTDEAPASTILPVASLVPNTTAVAKSGRSTGLTCSVIEATGLTASIKYQRGLGGPSFTVTFTNQIAVSGGTFSAEGDSGSLIVSQAGAQPVALLFAGSSTNTIGTPVATVLANFPDASNNTPAFVGPTARNPVAGCTSSGADAFSATSSQNASASQQTSTPALSAAQISQAESIKNQNAPSLMTDPAVLAVGVARSLDRPGRAAIVIFVLKSQPLVRPIPHTVGGILTRVIAVESLPKTGALDHESTAAFVKQSGPPAPAHPTPEQLAAAGKVKDKYSASLMKQPGILGVGVTSSLDDPSEPAILVFVEIGKYHNPIPLELDGVRVRVKQSDKFRAFGWGRPKPRR